MDNSNNHFDEIQHVLALLAKILSKGMDSQQRSSVLSDIVSLADWDNSFDEFKYFQMLLNFYDRNQDMRFAARLVDRIHASQAMFYQDVGPELSQIKYLIQKHKIGENVEISRPYVFVLLPFQTNFFSTYEQVIKPTLARLGCDVEHADEVMSVDSIIDIILTRIARAAFLVADTTNQRPNVFYEIGYAHALAKKVILIAQDPKDLPFDIRHWRHIIYKEDRPHTLAKELTEVAKNLVDFN